VSTRFKRLFVRNLLETAVDTSTTILALLKSLTKARITEVQKGKIVISTSGNGHRTDFSFPDGFSPSDTIDLLSELRDRYEEASAALIAAGTAVPTDTQLHNEMLDHLNRQVQVWNDFSGLRETPTEQT